MYEPNRSGTGCLGCEENGLGLIGIMSGRGGLSSIAARMSEAMQEKPQLLAGIVAAQEAEREQRRQAYQARQEAQQAAEQAEWEAGRQETEERLVRQQAEAEQRTGMIVIGVGGVVLLSLVGGGIWWFVKKRRAAEEE